MSGYLSTCMIVRDCQATLSQALASIKPWTDELIVVDTGSLDSTAQVAASFGARVLHFPWCDSFSAARNASLQPATGRWVFWMDSDDTIDPENGRKLADLARQAAPDNLLGYVMQVRCGYSVGRSDQDVTTVDHVKLVRNLPSIRFEGRIHEQIIGSIRRLGGEVGWTDIFVRHTGADYSENGKARKRERDLRLLHLELDESPRHPFVLFNLGMTYADGNDHRKAIDYLIFCVEESNSHDSHLRKAYSLLTLSFRAVGEGERAVHYCREGLALFPDDVELHFISGLLYFERQQFMDAEREYLTAITSAGGRYFSSFDRSLGGAKAFQNLAIVYTELRRHDLAALCLREAAYFTNSPELIARYAQALLRLHRLTLARRALDGISPNTCEFRVIEAEIQEASGNIVAARAMFENIARDFNDREEIEEPCARFFFAHGPEDLAEQFLQSLVRRKPNDGASLHNLGAWYARKRMYTEAIICLTRSLQHRTSAATDSLLQDVLALAPKAVGAAVSGVLGAE